MIGTIHFGLVCEKIERYKLALPWADAAISDDLSDLGSTSIFVHASGYRLKGHCLAKLDTMSHVSCHGGFRGGCATLPGRGAVFARTACFGRVVRPCPAAGAGYGANEVGGAQDARADTIESKARLTWQSQATSRGEFERDNGCVIAVVCSVQ